MKDKITTDDILGKKAVDPDGDILGVVIKMHISNSEKKIIGVTVDQGFMKPDLFVGIDFIKFFGIDTVLLNRAPESKYKGMKVVTADGNNVGTVKKIVKSGTRITEFIVERHISTFKSEEKSYSPVDVREIGERVILKEGIQ